MVTSALNQENSLDSQFKGPEIHIITSWNYGDKVRHLPWGDI